MEVEGNFLKPQKRGLCVYLLIFFVSKFERRQVPLTARRHTTQPHLHLLFSSYDLLGLGFQQELIPLCFLFSLPVLLRSTLVLAFLDAFVLKMKFGETFTEYLHGDQERFLHKFSHVEYKRLKKVLKSCRSCRAVQESCNVRTGGEGNKGSSCCQCESCPLCDQMFFSELTKEVSEIAGCFRSRVRDLLQLHVSTGMRRYMWYMQHCFKDDQQIMIRKGRVLIEYVTMNAIALRKILKKYDKVHCSVNGRNFRTRMRAQRIELLQSPWLIELGAFYINSSGAGNGESGDFFRHFSCELSENQPGMTLTLSDSVTLEYSLTCAICLDTVFNPYALGCGHLFCKACACSAASVLLFQGLKSALPESKCPVCREVGVYSESVHMAELDLLLKNRCKEYWKERLHAERAERVKQSKEYWDSQTKLMLGY